VKFNLLNVSFPLNFLRRSLMLKVFRLSQVCVAAIAQTECILALKKCMENERDLVAMCCETLTRLFKCQHVSGLFFKGFQRSFPLFVYPLHSFMLIEHFSMENVLFTTRECLAKKFGLQNVDDVRREMENSYSPHHFQLLVLI
jgi:hypothetical protein